MHDSDAPYPPDDRPDDDENDADDEQGDEQDDAAPQAVFVTTTVAIPVSVSRIPDERAPEGNCLGAFIGERLVARCAMEPEAIDHLLALELFDAPVPLALFAYEEEPGLQCRLFALVPATKLAEADYADEPWKASVPDYERAAAAAESEDEDEQMETILLGNIVRFASDRKHSDDLAAEAVDILQKIVTGGPLSDANQKAIDDLLGSL